MPYYIIHWSNDVLCTQHAASLIIHNNISVYDCKGTITIPLFYVVVLCEGLLYRAE